MPVEVRRSSADRAAARRLSRGPTVRSPSLATTSGSFPDLELRRSIRNPAYVGASPRASSVRGGCSIRARPHSRHWTLTPSPANASRNPTAHRPTSPGAYRLIAAGEHVLLSATPSLIQVSVNRGAQLRGWWSRSPLDPAHSGGHGLPSDDDRARSTSPGGRSPRLVVKPQGVGFTSRSRPNAPWRNDDLTRSNPYLLQCVKKSIQHAGSLSASRFLGQPDHLRASAVNEAEMAARR